jgi:hypothetical protein
MSKVWQTVTTCDGNPLCGLAKKIPAIKGEKRGAVDTGVLSQQQLIFCVDKMYKYPCFIESVYSLMSSSAYKIPEQGALDDSKWNAGGTSNFSKIKNGWWANYLLANYEKKGLTADMLQCLEKDDACWIPMLAAYDLQMPLQCVFTPEMSADGDFASLVMRKRSRLCGQRLENLIKHKCILPNMIDVSEEGGCYKLIFDSPEPTAKVTKIVHISGIQVEVPEHAPIDRKFELIDNFSDALARVIRPPTTTYLHTYFAEDVPFIKTMINPRAKKSSILKDFSDDVLVEETTKAKEKLEAQVASHVSVLKDTHTTLAKARTTRARTALVEKQTSRQKIRVIKLDVKQAAA